MGAPGDPVVEPAARFEAIQIQLEEPLRDAEKLSAVIGIPEWWPTGSRIGIALAHGAGRNHEDPLVEALQRRLTERKYLCMRFNFPFAELGKKRPDPPEVLLRAFRAALATLGRDPTSAPAHLFVGGVGLGGQVAALVSTQRLRIDGVFLLGYPLHARDEPNRNLNAEPLFRVVDPLLFVQGTRDRYCDLDTLRDTLKRVGAPKTLQLVHEADHQFKVPKRSGRSEESVIEELVEGVDRWCSKVVGL